MLAATPPPEPPRPIGDWVLTQTFQRTSDNLLPAGGDTRTWRLRALSGDRLLLQAQKGTGGFRRVVLRRAADGWAGTASGRDLCLDGHYDRPGSARFRYRLRVTASEDGRVTRIAASYRGTYAGCGTGTATETIGWRGVPASAGFRAQRPTRQ